MALALHDQSLPQRPRPPVGPRCRRAARTVHRPTFAVKTPPRYVRRRVIAAGLVVVVGVVGVMATAAVIRTTAALLAPLPAGVGGGSSAALIERTVQPGDTLWDIAESFPVGGDVRGRVDELARLNGGSLLRPGDAMKIPAAWTGR